MLLWNSCPLSVYLNFQPQLYSTLLITWCSFFTSSLISSLWSNCLCVKPWKFNHRKTKKRGFWISKAIASLSCTSTNSERFWLPDQPSVVGRCMFILLLTVCNEATKIVFFEINEMKKDEEWSQHTFYRINLPWYIVKGLMSNVLLFYFVSVSDWNVMDFCRGVCFVCFFSIYIR